MVECSIRALRTEIVEVNLFEFVYRLFHEDFSPLNLIFTMIYIHMARALIRRATPFFSVTGTQHQVTKAAESNLVTINRVLMCF